VLLTGAVWFLIAVVNDTFFAFLFACGATALAGASLICATFSLRGLRLQRGSVGDAATGQAAAMPVILKNELNRRRQPVVIIEQCPFSPEETHSVLVTPLTAGEERVVNRRILAMKRGEFELDRVVVRSGDPAGLFFRERAFSCPKTLLIAPGVEPIPDLRLRREDAVAATTGNPVNAAGTSQEFYGVREHTPSDGLRYIHWKSSARFGRLMVREFERNAVMSVAVLLDANEHFVSGPEHWSNLEYQVRAAASICSHLAGLYCNIAFAAGGARKILVPPTLASEAEQNLMYELAVLKPGGVPLAEVAFDLGGSLPRGTVIFCLSLATPKPLRQALEVLSHEGMTVRWLCARREAFQEAFPVPQRRRRVTALKEPDVDAAQLRPGMRLDRALCYRP